MASGLEVAEIFRRHGKAYRQAQAGHLGRVERRVMGAIEACRTAALGGHVERCADCGLVRIAYNSCRNRHCPKCQSLARAEWLAERQAELLPVPYFHVVFTVPAAVAEIAFHNKAAVYAIVFRAAAQTLCTIAADPRHLGAEIGVVAVLHTWGQNLHHHPHVHCVVPGGGLSLDGTRWIACRPGFFLPVRVLSRLFRRLFLEQLQAAFEAGTLGFYGDLARLADQAAFERHLGELAPARMGRLRQAALWQPRSGPRLSRPLHPSRCHRQQSARQARRRTGELPLAGLPAPRQAQGDDPCRQRVHPPLPLAYAAGWLPPHPPLWLPGQWPPPYQARPMPTASCCAAATAAATGRLSRALSTAHRRLARYLSVLWRRDAAAGTSPAPRSTEHAQLVR